MEEERVNLCEDAVINVTLAQDDRLFPDLRVEDKIIIFKIDCGA